MRVETAKKHSRAGEQLKVIPVNASEQTRRVQEAIARRAYEIFDSRGSASWHELEDWRQAESELVRRRCSGQMSLNDTLWIGTDAGIFEEGTIEIWVAPRQLTICGKTRVDKVDAHRKHIGSHPGGEMIFQALDLPAEIDPSHVTAKINGWSLEILLRKAQAKPKPEARAAAA
jgi:HSP20 family molecular chaperone IbpA